MSLVVGNQNMFLHVFKSSFPYVKKEIGFFLNMSLEYFYSHVLYILCMSVLLWTGSVFYYIFHYYCITEHSIDLLDIAMIPPKYFVILIIKLILSHLTKTPEQQTTIFNWYY